MEGEKLEKTKAIANSWLPTLKQPECAIANKFLSDELGLDPEGQKSKCDTSLSQSHRYYHAQCYARFCAKSKLERAMSSKRKVCGI